jgi:hypothetical protein
MNRCESIEWCNSWVTGALDDSGTPRLLLVGDSIAQSYFERVEKALAGRFLCARLTSSRCAGDPQLKRELAPLLDAFPFSWIHVNNGLHGWDYTEVDYAAGIADLFDFIAGRSPDSRLIWASTTPVWEGTPKALSPKTDRVRERNRLALRAAAERGLPFDNLFDALIGHPEWISDDGVHVNAAGQEALAGQVVRSVLLESEAAGKPAPAPAETVDTWRGFRRRRFIIQGRDCWIVEPKQALPGKPWTWCMEFPDAFTERTAVPMLLEKGFHHLFMDVGNTFGCPFALRQLDAFYAAVLARGLAPRGALIGISRGALYAFNWAARNPGKVLAIYADAGVCDFKSWPAGRGRGAGSAVDWQALQACYGFASEAEALGYRRNPVDNLVPLAEAGVQLLHVVGGADDVVPVEENAGLLSARYLALGGRTSLIHKPGVGHHPHGLDNPALIADFISKATTR